jgi:signal transduction histidine kinase
MQMVGNSCAAGIAALQETEEISYVSQLINAQEEERRRIARELHDDLNQRMGLLSIELGLLRKLESPREVFRRLGTLQKQVQEMSGDIHRLSYRLHPSKLDHVGLATAMKSLCQEVSETGMFEVVLKHEGCFGDLSSDVTLCIFRITQEALGNCMKHSKAKMATVILTNTCNELRLSISDNGRGFDMKSEVLEQGLGFTSMKERLRIVGGKITISSKRNLGTFLEVSIPMLESVSRVDSQLDEIT